jgi:zinc transporter ZupT
VILDALLPFYICHPHFFSTMAGGLFVIKFRSFIGAISALAAGILIAISFLDLLPESLKLASDLNIPLEYTH